MLMNVNEKSKILELWFTKDEDSHSILPLNIEKEIEKYKAQKYKICMYQSGLQDIKANILDFFLKNLRLALSFN